eukprot:11500274-Heterocapsa_arctica.AAC.1
MQGLVTDDSILDKEEIKHGMVEVNGHKQIQEALTAMGMPGEGLVATLKANENSRHGWVPHMLLYNWLQGVWEGAWTSD